VWGICLDRLSFSSVASPFRLFGLLGQLASPMGLFRHFVCQDFFGPFSVRNCVHRLLSFLGFSLPFLLWLSPVSQLGLLVFCCQMELPGHFYCSCAVSSRAIAKQTYLCAHIPLQHTSRNNNVNFNSKTQLQNASATVSESQTVITSRLAKNNKTNMVICSTDSQAQLQKLHGKMGSHQLAVNGCLNYLRHIS